jgi:hypothetical protein
MAIVELLMALVRRVQDYIGVTNVNQVCKIIYIFPTYQNVTRKQQSIFDVD